MPNNPTPYADTQTPNLGLTKIEVGASNDTWGDKLNANSDTLDAKVATKTELSNGLAGKANTSHTHTIAQVTNLQATLDAKQDETASTLALAPLVPDPDTVPYFDSLTTMAKTFLRAFGRSLIAAADAAAARTILDAAATVHTHTTAQVTGLDTALAGKASITYVDSENDAQDAATASALAGKANTSHTHTIAQVTDLQTALDAKAPLASPAFSGNPTAPTPTAGDNDTSIATTAFVNTAIAGKANTDSPALAGNPTAPTPARGDKDTSIATTAFVQDAVQVEVLNQQAAATYTLVAADVSKMVRLTAAAGCVVTVPAGVFAAGNRVDLLSGATTGNVSVAPGSGLSLFSKDSKRAINGTHAAATLYFVDANNAILIGDLA